MGNGTLKNGKTIKDYGDCFWRTWTKKSNKITTEQNNNKKRQRKLWIIKKYKIIV